MKDIAAKKNGEATVSRDETVGREHRHALIGGPEANVFAACLTGQNEEELIRLGLDTEAVLEAWTEEVGCVCGKHGIRASREAEEQ